MSRIVVMMKGYPRLSETFIADEIRGLEKLGIKQLIVALRRPYDPYLHPVHEEIEAEVLYLPEYLKDDRERVKKAQQWAKGQENYKKLRKAFEQDRLKDRSAGLFRRLGQAIVLAHELPRDITHLHTHYLHVPATVTRYAALLTGLDWSFSAHAKDIWTGKDWDLRQKLNSAKWGVTCTRVNADYLKSLADDPDRIELLYHGLDFSAFPAPPDRSTRDNSHVRLLSIGRAVEKKGYGTLWQALKLLADNKSWSLTHIGGGELSEKLKDLATRLELSPRITMLGPQPRTRVFAELEAADLFVLPSQIAKSGDRDGLPNVLMEAQAFGLACISTHVSAIPEIISHNETGLLIAERDAEALAAAIKILLEDKNKRLSMGTEGAKRVRREFEKHPGLERLAKKFRLVS